MPDEMTIASLAIALRGIPRDAIVLIETPDGPKKLRTIRGDRVLVTENGEVKIHYRYDRYAIILDTEE